VLAQGARPTREHHETWLFRRVRVRWPTRIGWTRARWASSNYAVPMWPVTSSMPSTTSFSTFHHHRPQNRTGAECGNIGCPARRLVAFESKCAFMSRIASRQYVPRHPNHCDTPAATTRFVRQHARLREWRTRGLSRHHGRGPRRCQILSCAIVGPPPRNVRAKRPIEGPAATDSPYKKLQKNPSPCEPSCD